MTSKYLVGVLYYGNVDKEHDNCMRAIEKHPRIAGFAQISGCPYICIGRSTIVEKMLSLPPEVEGLLFIDHDIIFDPSAVERILDSCDQTRGVVGAGYSMRSPGAKMIGAVDTAKIPEGKKLVFFEGGGLYSALYLGMGFTAIHRSALETIGKDLPYFENGVTDIPIRPYFALLREEGKWYGEDVSFCLRAERAGVPVDMDTSVRVWHKGTYTYGLEDCGIIVPWLSSLEGIEKTAPSPVQSPVSRNPAITAAIADRAGTSTEELLGLPKPERQYPETVDIVRDPNTINPSRVDQFAHTEAAGLVNGAVP